MESVHPYLRETQETGRGKNGKSGAEMRPPGSSSGMWLLEFISEMQRQLQGPQVILRREFSLLPPAETFKCHLGAACDLRFFPSG